MTEIEKKKAMIEFLMEDFFKLVNGMKKEFPYLDEETAMQKICVMKHARLAMSDILTEITDGIEWKVRETFKDA